MKTWLSTLAVCVGAFTCACDPLADPGTAGAAVFTFSLDGTDLDFSAGASHDCGTGATNNSTDGVPGVSFSASENCSSGRHASVAIPVQPEATGTYSCGTNGVLASYSDADQGGGGAGESFITSEQSTVTPPQPQQPCTITVSSVTADFVEGTFLATVQSTNDGGSSRVITDGHFKVPPANGF